MPTSQQASVNTQAPSNAAPQAPGAPLTSLFSLTPWSAAMAYAVDAWQRSVLYADVMRQRGNQYQEHLAQQEPNVLSMQSEIIARGNTLPRPVNYMLSRIIPPEGVIIDPRKRPFVVVDPRAGHGPGIGGFKPESELGVAIRAGHPCYFVGFLPDPEPGQTVEDVMRAEASFLETVIALHPEAEGKPVVIGNCQAGWQVMMTAAMRPELFGPIILAGAPLSYWAGWRGMNPMRYLGGLLGGSWMTALTSDMGHGKFDGAWLVRNFEFLNPANTLWDKQYHLYANVDTETERYLGFEKWWGGHVYLNGDEIQYIVDNLFIGNRLSTAELVTTDGIRLDLRNIQSPIIVFCSRGDNITPPPQALGWLTDVYQNDEEIRAHGQTIVYAVHESIGHLGIFVSGSVARKEHQEFTSNIDLIDVLPTGIYEAIIRDKKSDTPNADLTDGPYIASFERRKLDQVRKIIEPIQEDDRRFATVARLSEVNLGLYRRFLQPWVQLWATPTVAETLRVLHPLRLQYEAFSDTNPLAESTAKLAEKVREERVPVAADNIFRVWQEILSRSISSGLDIWRVTRDDIVEQLFMTIYGSPLAQTLAGLGAHPETPARKHPGVSPEHRDFVKNTLASLRAQVSRGGLREACIRMLVYVGHGEGAIDERNFNLIRRLRVDHDKSMTLERFKEMVREQALMMMLDMQGAIQSMPILLSQASETSIRQALEQMIRVVTAAGDKLGDTSQARLEEMRAIFESAADRAARFPILGANPQATGAGSQSRVAQATETQPIPGLEPAPWATAKGSGKPVPQPDPKPELGAVLHDAAPSVTAADAAADATPAPAAPATAASSASATSAAAPRKAAAKRAAETAAPAAADPVATAAAPAAAVAAAPVAPAAPAAPATTTAPATKAAPAKRTPRTATAQRRGPRGK
ncbi:DUF3141 domain-containing protein [Kerstersia similis]|uniref:DUF3141 domain-containing protein n=1 Tax=Kerstersia similis TaxID=206505 RepID=UPI0039F03FFE